MTSTQDYINQMIAATLFPNGQPLALPPLDEQQWQDIFRELSAQAILGILEPIIDQLHLPGKVRQYWDNNITSRILRYCQLSDIQTEATALLEAQHIPYAILKGFAAAKYYSKPLLRHMHDIDMIVPPEFIHQATALLAANGFEIVTPDENDTRHVCLQKDQCSLEVHRRFSANNDERGQKLDELIFQQMDRVEVCWLGGFNFNMLPELTNGLILLQHIAQHLRSGLGLRQMIDWFEFSSQCLHDDQWPDFKQQADLVGLTDLAVVSTRLGQLYFGLPDVGITWCRQADRATCDALLHHLYRSGNLGTKNLKDNQTIFAMHRMQHGLFRTLQSCGLNNWKAAKKYPLLRPFAWIYQACRYVREGFQGKNTISKVWKNFHESRKLDKLIKGLKL